MKNGRDDLKEIIEEYGGIVVGVMIGAMSIVMIGTILYHFLWGYFNHFATVLYG